MIQLRKLFDATNINTIVTIISILSSIVVYINGILTLEMSISIIAIIMFLLLVRSMHLYNEILNKNKEAENELGKVDGRIQEAVDSVYAQKREEIDKLERDIAFWKDRSTNLEDMLALKEREITQWKDDCRMLFEIRNELELEIQRLNEEHRRVYELYPSSNPRRQTTYSMGAILRPSTPQDERLIDINRRLRAP
jgi:hypothetical protein